jgi:hypothetical protein
MIGSLAAALLMSGRPSEPEFTPGDLTDLFAWYRADLGVTESSGTVSAWADQSSNGHDLTMSGDPNYNATRGPNSTPDIYFDGTGDQGQTTVFTTLAQPFHVFAVTRTATLSTNSCVIAGNGTSTRILNVQSGMRMFFGTVANTVAHTDAANYYLWEAFLSGASSTLTRGSGSAAAGNPGSGGITQITLAALPGASNQDCYISEVVFCEAEVTGQELTDLRAYFAARYGVATN